MRTSLRRFLAPTLAPLRHRLFAGVWTASLVSNFGTMIQSVAAAWLMTTIDGRPEMVALVQSSTTLPIMVFALAAGALADIFSRKTVMLVAQWLMMVASALLAAVSYLDALTPWALLAFTFVIGCGRALYGPAWQASVGEQVPPADLPGAVALNSLGFNLARSAGPAVGGVLVATLGVPAAFLANALSNVGLIGILTAWRRPAERRTLPPERVGDAMAAGLRYAALEPAIRSVLQRSLLFGVAGSAVWALLPLVARDMLNGGATLYGLLFAGMGAGAVVGAFLATPFRNRFAAEASVATATLMFAASLAVLAFSRSPAMSFAALVLGGTGWVLALSTFNVSVQLASPRWVVGRTLAIYQMLTFGGMALGAWGWGHAAAQFGLPAALTASAAAMLAGPIIGIAAPLRNAVRTDLTPSASLGNPGATLELEALDGSVTLTIEYDVAPEDAAAFRAAMTEMRRIRRRDGARRWQLLQDVGDPRRWVESYALPSWTEHLRHHLRATRADAETEARVRAFHRGAEPPQVRRLVERPPVAAPEAQLLPDANLSPEASGVS